MWAKDRSSVERSLMAIAAIAATIGVLTTTLTSAPSPVIAEPASPTPIVTAVANTATEAVTTDAPPSDDNPGASSMPEVTITQPDVSSPIPTPPEPDDPADDPAEDPAARTGHSGGGGHGRCVAHCERSDRRRCPCLRLYHAFYGRQPDMDGARFWIEERRSGASIDTIAAAFAESEEFAATYGDLDDAAFVESAYRTALGRDIDTNGFAYWVVELDRGVSRESVLVFFTSSDEFTAASHETGAKRGSHRFELSPDPRHRIG